MLGFVIPLLAFCGIEGVLGLSLLLPLPFARPSIAICKLTNTQAGRSVLVTVSVILFCLLLAPLYDLTKYHDNPEETAGANAERRSDLHAVNATLACTILNTCTITSVSVDALDAGSPRPAHTWEPS